MQKRRHIRIAGLLMLLSWLFLFVFVGQWILLRYSAEKNILVRELDRQFSETKLQVMDSILMINLVNPLFGFDKQKSKNSYLPDSVPLKLIVIDSSLSWNAKSNPQPCIRYKITLTDSLCNGPFGQPGQDQSHSDTSVTTILNSIRLIIGRSGDSAGKGALFRQIIPSEIDTHLFKEILNERMEKQGLNFRVIWHSASAGDSNLISGSGIHFRDKIFNEQVGAEVYRFSWYLIKKIIPQIIFAILLMMLSGMAFVFIYRSLKKQQVLNELRNDFVGNITHELKTPVATIKVALESLRTFDMKKDPVVSGEYLEMASQEIHKLDQLINKVLNISMLEDHKQLIVPVPENLKTVVSNAVFSLKKRLEQEEAEVVVEAPGEDYTCLLDVLFVEGVLINLIDNSLKYSQGKAFIKIELSGDPEQVKLLISDRGPGIPEVFHKKVFDKFFRVPAGEVHNIKGHGLGLSYAAQVMKQHRGSIQVMNNAEGGCIFTLIFPRV